MILCKNIKVFNTYETEKKIEKSRRLQNSMFSPLIQQTEYAYRLENNG
jgi:hypothetical protein